MNSTNRLSTDRGSTPINEPKVITMSFNRISHSRRKMVLSPMRNTFAKSQMNAPASGRLRTVWNTSPAATMVLPMYAHPPHNVDKPSK